MGTAVGFGKKTSQLRGRLTASDTFPRVTADAGRDDLAMVSGASSVGSWVLWGMSAWAAWAAMGSWQRGVGPSSGMGCLPALWWPSDMDMGGSAICGKVELDEGGNYDDVARDVYRRRLMSEIQGCLPSRRGSADCVGETRPWLKLVGDADELGADVDDQC